MAVTAFRIAGCLYTGPGALQNLGVELNGKGLKKPLIVTDQGVLRAGVVQAVEDALKEAGIPYALFAEVVPNPTDKNVEDCRVLYEKEKCDSLVAVGGGSVMDCAKACGAVQGGDKPVSHYEGYDKLERPMPFYVAIATTAGTGSESTMYSVITSTQTDHHYKMVLGDVRMMPSVAIIDPMLMLGLPPHITAATGIDAMTHSIEGYISTLECDYADAFAKESIRIIAKYLPRAVANGADIEAREKMAYAQTMGGITCSHLACGLAHGMAHVLSSWYRVAHGDGNAVMLPYVLEFNKAARLEKIGELADLIGIPTTGMSAFAKADAAIAGIQELCTLVGIPKTLSELATLRNLKIDKKDIPQLAVDAKKDNNTNFNPRVPSVKEIEDLYHLAWG